MAASVRAPATRTGVYSRVWSVDDVSVGSQPWSPVISISPPATAFTSSGILRSRASMHRNDPQGYGRCIEALDRRIPELVNAVAGGLMLITGDHGCDPTDTSSTDHTREYTPVLVAGARTDAAIDLGIRQVFGDVGATVAQVLGVDTNGLAGTSFADELGLS